MQTEPGVIPKKIPFPSKQEKRPLLPLMNTIREKEKSIKRVCNDLSVDACRFG